MRIKTWKAWHDPSDPGFADYSRAYMHGPRPVRIVPEATWRRIMAVVNLADQIAEIPGSETELNVWGKLDRAVAALRDHERKRK